MDNFIDARRAYQRLQTKYSVGKLNKETFQKAVEELAVRDPWGNIWQIGVVSGDWYRFDGYQWVKDYPPPADPGSVLSDSAMDDATAMKLDVGAKPFPWYIIFESGGLTGKRIPIDQPLVLGRSKNINVHLDDDMASRRHAIIEKSGQFYQIIDQNSTNGTELNGKLVREPTNLKHGDRIRIGDTIIRVEGDLAAEHTAEKQTAKPLPVAPSSAPLPQAPPLQAPPPPPMVAAPPKRQAPRPRPPQPPKHKRRGCIIALISIIGIIICLAVIIVGGFLMMPELFPDIPGITSSDQTLVDVENLTNFPICGLYFSPTNSTDWGNNLIGSGETIPAGTYISYNVEVGTTIDIYAEDCGGNPLDVLTGLYVPVEGLTVTFSPIP